MTTHTLVTTEADIVYDIRGPLPTADGRPPLFMIAQPMDASGFSSLASYFPDRTVITYCTSPHEASSAQVAQKLAEHGYKNVHPLFIGLEAWQKAGLPLEPK